MENEVEINVDIKEIIFIQDIGCGSFGDVYTAKCPTKFGDKIIAVKKLRHSEESSRKVKRELIVLSRLEHPNIVTFYGISKDLANKFHILLEYSECGSLYNFLHYSKTIFPVIYKYIWMIQCAKGIAYLHERNIIHRDLKTANILLYDNFQTLKLCDFGTVKEIASNNTTNTGTASYMAPEVADSGNYKTKCDVYSFGIIFWEVMSRKKPFYHLGSISGPLIQYRVVARGARPPICDIQGSENLDGIKELIIRCWHKEPKERPTMHQVLQQLEPYGYTEFENNLFNVEISETNERLEVKDLILQVPNTIKRVPWQDIILDEETIKIGAFGAVYKANWRATDVEKTVAIKTYNIEYINHYFERELKCISSLEHDNIITFYGISVDNNNRPVLLLEYADYGSLDIFLHGTERIMDYSYIDALKWMHQCVTGMSYMHDRNIIHRNLNPETLLFVHNFQTLKICSSIYMTEEATLMTKLVGTTEYMAPEAMSADTYSKECDIYSFGIILWEVMSRKKPFANMRNFVEFLNEILIGTRPDLNDVNIFTHSEPIKDLMIKCWDSDSKKRPTMKDLVVSIGNILLTA